MIDFANYSKNFINLYDKKVPALLAGVLARAKNDFSFLDLGCGDGSLLYSLHKNGCFKDAARVVGVDLSTERLARLKNRGITELEIICSDVSFVKDLKPASFNFIATTQVIEHIADDKKMLIEIYRLLKDDGIAYISSVVKKRYAWYVHRCNGRWALDPTHLREYPSGKAFADLMEAYGLLPFEIKLTRYYFTPMDFVIRRIYFPLARGKDVNSFFLRHKIMNKLRRLQIPVAGYFIVEVLAKKG